MQTRYLAPQTIEEQQQALQTKGHPVRLMALYNSLCTKLQKVESEEHEKFLLARKEFLHRLYEKLTGRYIIG